MKKRIITAAAVALGLTAAVAPTVDARPGKPGPANIVETAIAANAELGVFDTVLTAATCDYFEGAIAGALTSDDKVTLFAPTDDAFAALGLNEGNVCDAFNGEEGSVGDPAALANILTYHVTDGRRFSNSVFNKNNSKPIEMLNGGTVVSNPELTLSDEAGQEVGIVAPFFDINANNGVIHVIDTVLLPGS
jgi:uncharacterized surface protein with fasciclin (FAS1) repeats